MSEPTTASGTRSVVPARLIAAQARASTAALAVSVVIVALATFVTAAVPVLTSEVTTTQVRDAVTQAGPQGHIVVSVPLSDTDGIGFALIPDLADSAEYVGGRIEAGMPAELRAALHDPITTLVGPELKMGAIDGVPARLRFAYIARADGPEVTWTDGRAPASTGTAIDVSKTGQKLPIEVGLSREVAEALGVEIGDMLPALDPDEVPLTVTVTGIFEPADESAFVTVPTLLTPRLSLGEAGQLNVTALVTAESAPAARLGVFPRDMDRTYTYPPNIESLTSANAGAVQTAARGLASGKQVFEVVGAKPTVSTRLDVELERALQQSAGALAQASVLLLAVVALVGLTQLLAAMVMTERRGGVIAQLGERGASARGVFRALGVESLLVALLGTAVGLGAQQLLVPGPISWWWVAGPIAVAVLAPPLLGVRAARRRRLPPAAQSRRRRSLGTPALRRITGFVTVAVAALVSFLALRSRGTAASQGSIAADLLVLAAPVLCAVAVGLVVAWALPYAARGLRALTSRSSGAGPLLAASRLRSPVAAVLTLVVAASIASFAASASATVQRGLADAAWDVVGADAVALAGPSTTLPDAPPDGDGLTWATASGLEVGHLTGGPRSQAVRVVAVDAARMAQLARLVPDGHPKAWETLAAAPLGDDGAVPMLESANLTEVEKGTLVWGRESATVTFVERAPDLPGTSLDSDALRSPGVVVVDRAVLAEALGEPVPATVVWVMGPDAGDALSSAVTGSEATVTTRESWHAGVLANPVSRALVGLFAGAVIAAVLLAGLGVSLLVAAGARERARAMGRLRLVGLSRARTTRIARAEVALPVMITTAVGVLVGFALTWTLTSSLGLQSVTGQSRAPEPIIAWWMVLLPLVLGVFAWLAVGVALRLGRPPRLGEVMRVDY